MGATCIPEHYGHPLCGCSNSMTVFRSYLKYQVNEYQNGQLPTSTPIWIHNMLITENSEVLRGICFVVFLIALYIICLEFLPPPSCLFFFGPPWTNAKPKNRTLGPWGDGKEGNSINSSLIFFPTVQTSRDFHQSGVGWGLQKGLVRWCKFEANGWEHVAGSPQQKNS